MLQSVEFLFLEQDEKDYQISNQKMKTTNIVNVKEMNFEQLFRHISPEEISENVFALVGKVFLLLLLAEKIIITL